VRHHGGKSPQAQKAAAARPTEQGARVTILLRDIESIEVRCLVFVVLHPIGCKTTTMLHMLHMLHLWLGIRESAVQLGARVSS